MAAHWWKDQLLVITGGALKLEYKSGLRMNHLCYYWLHDDVSQSLGGSSFVGCLLPTAITGQWTQPIEEIWETKWRVSFIQNSYISNRQINK